MKIWHLKKGSEKKFRAGHPWVFSSELAQSPKGTGLGEAIELQDYSGGFLARGYGHPNSLISFRTLSTRKDGEFNENFFAQRFAEAARLRQISGVHPYSHRLCFAEGDYLPGLVIDRYRLVGGMQAIVVQASTAGMDRLLPTILSGLERFVSEEHQRGEGPSWEQSSVVVANDSKSRLMEGLTADPKRLEKTAAGFEPASAQLIVQPGLHGLEPLRFEGDLITGQKTGFFLDQRFNIQLTCGFFSELVKTKKELRVLDLCCYIGQWGTQLAHTAAALGAHARVTLLDASAKALELAAKNVEKHGGTADPRKADVLEGLKSIEDGAFDVVICDPPAFIKKKKDLPTGSLAYAKLNREAIRKTARGGLFVSCSCSGLFTEEDFRSMLARSKGSAVGEVRWIARGGHSPDHPQRPEFPQGTYLKSWIGVIT